ncbi:MAG TPA: hypothetical protein VK816_04370 [Jatrophihabitantaceae bacterium]|nr:hypothetical protein [Jatrophihabitantaceae bacterium]
MLTTDFLQASDGVVADPASGAGSHRSRLPHQGIDQLLTLLAQLTYLITGPVRGCLSHAFASFARASRVATKSSGRSE